ncbi:MAG: disulfide bond formation protein B, partial [Elusimicrobia bacterium]|nr:disulfide bond formation protein B [Elusimicrobiota bacterium]
MERVPSRLYIVSWSGSEIRHFPPCVLCWYQRIAMYPIVVLAAVGIWHDDRKAHRYLLPLSV